MDTTERQKMKKLLGIIILGLLLASCSENQKNRMLESCADETFEESFGIQPILKLNLKAKLHHESYYSHYGRCEEKLKSHPIRFKEKWN